MRHITRRRLLGALAGTAGLALLSACSSSQPAAKPAETKPAETKPAAPAAAAQPTTAPAKPAEAVKPAEAAKPAAAAPATTSGTGLKITLWSSFSANLGEQMQAMVDRFNQSQKDVVVDNQFQGSYEETGQKLTAALQARQAPDVSIISDVWWFKFYLNKAIIPLDELMTANKVEKTDFVDAFINEGTRKGQTFWLPYARSTPLFYYNKQAWQEVGLPDRGPETWMELKEWSAKLMKKDGANISRYAFALPGANGYIDWSFQNNIWGWGGSYSDPDFQVHIGEQAGVDAAEFLRQAVIDGWAGTPANADNDFRSGVAASLIGSTGGLAGHEANAKFPLGTAFLPKGPAAFGCPTGGAGLGILAQAPKDRQEAAFKFMTFATSTEQAALWSQQTGYMPVRKSAIESAPMQNFYKEKPNYQTAGKQLALVRPQDTARVFVPNGQQLILKGLERVTINKEPAEAALKDLQSSLQKESDAIARQVKAIEG